MGRSYEEIRIYDGIAERTGNRVDRPAAGPRATLCSSINQLGASSRRLGDGLYYLAESEWPEETESVDLNRSWTPLG